MIFFLVATLNDGTRELSFADDVIPGNKITRIRRAPGKRGSNKAKPKAQPQPQSQLPPWELRFQFAKGGDHEDLLEPAEKEDYAEFVSKLRAGINHLQACSEIGGADCKQLTKNPSVWQARLGKKARIHYREDIVTEKPFGGKTVARFITIFQVGQHT